MLERRKSVVLPVVVFLTICFAWGLLPRPVAAQPGTEALQVELSTTANERAQALAAAAGHTTEEPDVAADLEDGVLDELEGEAMVLPKPALGLGDAVITEAGPLPEEEAAKLQGVLSDAPQEGRVEDPSMRTERSVTYLNPDGTYVTEQHTSAISLRDGESWVAIDDSLIAKGDRLEQKRGAIDADVARFADDELATFRPTPDTEVAFALVDARRVEGRVDGAQIVYRGAREGLDIELQPTPSGVKETLVLASAEVGADLLFDLRLEGLTARKDESGSISILDKSGKVQAEIPKGYAIDAGGATTFEVDYELSEDGASLRVVVDAGWLTSDERAWPVRVDPTTLTPQSTSDAYVDTCRPNTNYSTGSELRTGLITEDQGLQCQTKTLLRFDGFTAEQAGGKVLSAELLLYNTFSNSHCFQYPLYAHSPALGWNAASVTWNTQPSYYLDPVGSGSFAHACGGGAGGWGTVSNLGPLVQRWWSGESANNGLAISTQPSPVWSENDPLALKKFFSADTGFKPYLSVRWTPHRATYQGSMSWVVNPSVTNAGKYKLWVRNEGGTTWNPAQFKVSYRLYKADGTTLNSPASLFTPIPSTMSPGGGYVPVDVNVTALPPGSYQIRFTMVYDPNGVPHSGDEKWFDLEHSLPWSIAVTIPNLAPVIESLGPAGVTNYSPPSLTVEAYNPDNVPWYPLHYLFKTCTDAAMTQGCISSGAGFPSPTGSWEPTHLKWGSTYYWNVTVLEGGPSPASTTSPAVKISMIPPQPSDLSNLGGSGDQTLDRGVNVATGNYSTSATDASVAAGSLPLAIERTYNSLDSRTHKMFGRGWMSRYDTRVVDEPDRPGMVLVTYGDGRSERFGRNSDGTYGVSERYQTRLSEFDSGGGVIERILTTANGIRMRFSLDGNLLLTRYPDDSALTFGYSSVGGAQRLTSVTATPSGRKLTLTWTSSAPYHVASVSTDAVSGAGASTWTYGYQGDNLHTVCGPRSGSECSTYDYGTTAGATDRIVAVSTPGNSTGTNTTLVELEYHSDGTVAAQTDGAGSTWSYADDRDSHAGLYRPLPGAQLYDGVLSSGASAEVPLAGIGGLPVDGSQISAVVLNVRGFNATNGGWVNAFPSDKTGSVAGVRMVANRYTDGMLTVAPGGSNHTIKISATAPGTSTTSVRAWVVGWYTKAGVPGGGSSYHPISHPVRFLDSRPASLQVGPYATKWNAGTTRTIDVTNPSGTGISATDAALVPATGVSAVAINVVAIGPSASSSAAGSYMTAHAATDPLPPGLESVRLWQASNRGNAIIVKVGTDGNIKLYNNSGTVDVAIEVLGWYGAMDSDTTGSLYRPHPGQGTTVGRRLIDSRPATGQVGPYATQWPTTGSRPVRFAGAAGIPISGLTSVQATLTGLLPVGSARMVGFEGAGVAVPTTANLHVQPGQIMSNSFLPAIDADGGIAIANAGSSLDVLIDVQGWFERPTRTVSVTSPSPSVDPTTYFIDAKQRVVGRTDAEGFTKGYLYNLSSQVTRIMFEDGSVRTFGYTDEGLLGWERHVDAGGCPILAWFNGFAECEPPTPDLWRQKTYSYSTISGIYYSPTSEFAPGDPRFGKPIAVFDENAAYRNWNLPYALGIFGKDNHATTYTYNAFGQVTSTRTPATDDAPSGRTTTSEYTAGTEAAVGGGLQPQRKLRKTIGPDGTEILYEYDAKGDLRRATGPYPSGDPSGGVVIEYAYDALGRKTSKKEISDAHPAGLTTTYSYDKASQLVTETAPAVVDVVESRTHQARRTFTYDGNGNITSRRDADLNGWDLPRETTYTYDSIDRVVAEQDPAGLVTTYDYDEFSNPTHIDVGGVVTSLTYTERHQLATKTLEDFADDPVGSPGSTRDVLLESHGYNSTGQRAFTIDARGRRVDFSWVQGDRLDTTVLRDFREPSGDLVLEDLDYDLAGNVVATKSPTPGLVGDVLAVESTYNAAGQLETSVYDPGGLERALDLTYDLAGNVTGRTFGDAARSETTETEYDHLGNPVVVVVDPAGLAETTETDYDDRGLLVGQVDPTGALTTYAYDAMGRLATTTLPEVDAEAHGVAPSTANPQVRTGYNTFGEVTSAKTPSGAITSIARDVRGFERVVTLPGYTPPGAMAAITPTQTSDYDVAGHLVAVTDRSGGVTDIDNDAVGRPVRVRGPEVGGQRPTSTSVYDDVGNLVQTVDPVGSQVVSEYDDLDRLSQVTQVERYPAQNIETTIAYDDTTLPLTVNTAGIVSQSGYNRAGELVSASKAGGTTSYDRDLVGRATRVVDPLGRALRTVYDMAGRETSVQQLAPNGSTLATATVAYDLVGREATSTDFRGNATVESFDALGRTTAVDTPGGDPSYGYDLDGNRVRVTDGRGNATWTTFTSWGQPEKVIEPSTTAHPSLGDRTWTSSYDAAGQMVKLEAPGGVVRETTFDELGRPVSETGTGAEASTDTRNLAWDLAGRLTGYGTPAGDATVTYNDRGLPLVVDDPEAGTTTYAYNGSGQPTSRVDSAGTAVLQYNGFGQLATESNPLTGDARTYSYHEDGAIDQATYGAGKITESFTYDDWGRLDVHDLKRSGTTLWAADYGYDSNGNRTSETITPSTVSGAGTSSYGYDAANRLTSWAAPSGTHTYYLWDGADNRTWAGARNFAYDQRNRLTSEVEGGVTTTHTYAPRGTLRTSTVGSGSTQDHLFDAFDRTVSDAGVPGSLAYDSLDRVRSRNNVAIDWEGLTTNLTSDGTTTYTYRADGSPFGTTDGVDPKEIFTDVHGDVIGITDANDSALDVSRSYDPFGVVTTAGTTAAQLGYQGDWTDPDSGRVNANARQYTPGTATFTARDSFDDPLANNRYGYGAGNPLRYSDPTGHWFGEGLVGTLASAGTAVLERAVDVAKPTAEWALRNPAKAGFYFAGAANGVNGLSIVAASAGPEGKTGRFVNVATKGGAFFSVALVATGGLLWFTQKPAGESPDWVPDLPPEVVDFGPIRPPTGPGTGQDPPPETDGESGVAGPSAPPPPPPWIQVCLADFVCRGTQPNQPMEETAIDRTPAVMGSVDFDGAGTEADVRDSPLIDVFDTGIMPDTSAGERVNTQVDTNGGGSGNVGRPPAPAPAGSDDDDDDDDAAKRKAWSRTIQHFKQYESEWMIRSAHAEAASGHRYSGGISTEEVFQRGADWLVRHRVFSAGGKMLHETFRPFARFGLR